MTVLLLRVLEDIDLGRREAQVNFYRRYRVSHFDGLLAEGAGRGRRAERQCVKERCMLRTVTCATAGWQCGGAPALLQSGPNASARDAATVSTRSQRGAASRLDRVRVLSAERGQALIRPRRAAEGRRRAAAATARLPKSPLRGVWSRLRSRRAVAPAGPPEGSPTT